MSLSKSAAATLTQSSLRSRPVPAIWFVYCAPAYFSKAGIMGKWLFGTPKVFTLLTGAELVRKL